VRGHPEAAAFWALALLYILPVWAFRYLPTQDGPSHLENAQVLKDYGNPASGYRDFFKLRAEPLPNLSSHLLLAGLLFVFPPLTVEKVLVSLYVLGFAGAFRYFLAAFGPRARPLSWAGLLLVYNRCFWMGFYNCCLSLVLLWVILGYCLRPRPAASQGRMLVLLLLFTAAYFTHLVGFLLAIAGAVSAMLLARPRRLLGAALVLVAAAPAACLAMAYFDETGFFGSHAALHLLRDPLARLGGHTMAISLWQELVGIDNELAGHHLGSVVSGALVFAAYLAWLAALAAAEFLFARPQQHEGGPGRLFPAVFGLLLLGVYLLVPDHLGTVHGGFLKARLAPLPFLLGLACLREPACFEARLLVRVVTALLLAANLALVTATVRDGNEALAQYTAGIEVVGPGHRLFVIQGHPASPPPVDPLLHAAHYYCLGTGNVDLDNYEATMPHFPVMYRRGVGRGRDEGAGNPPPAAADVAICWQASPSFRPHGPAGWEEIFSQGPLRIYRRPPGR
jgi:hypothetical protein